RRAAGIRSALARRYGCRFAGGPGRELALELGDALLQARDLRLLIGRRRRRPGQKGAVAPPVQADLLGLVDRADQQADLDRQELDVRQPDADVAGDDEALVQDPVQHVDETVGAIRSSPWALQRHAATAAPSNGRV